MRKPLATMEWHIVQDDQHWQQLVQSPAPLSPKPRRLAGGLGEALWLLLLVGAVGGAYWWIKQTGWQQAQTELAAVVERDKAAVFPIQLLALQGEQAIVHIPTVGQTRVYQRTASGWQQSLHFAEDWGTPQQQATPSFHWQYHAQDAPVIALVAPQIETLYTILRQDFALPVGPRPVPLIIEVSPTAWPEQLPAFSAGQQRLLVPTPALYRATIALSDADVLAQSIALPLLNAVMMQAAEQYPSASVWQPLWQGLRLWHLWDGALPLATWQTPVVQWLYGDRVQNGAAQPVLLPAEYAELCATHALWLTSPMQIGIPLWCTDFDKAAWYTAVWGERTPPTYLPQLVAPPSAASSADLPTLHQPEPYGRTVALVTLLDYAVVTYGRDRLPRLVAGLGEYPSWETLLPAVYGVSATEFEAGWQHYLRHRTGNLPH